MRRAYTEAMAQTGPEETQAGTEEIHGDLRIGAQVRVTQQSRWGTTSRKTTVEGEVVEMGQERTGSWFAHSKDHKLWLDRLQLKKADGELIYLNLDQYSRVDVLD